MPDEYPSDWLKEINMKLKQIESIIKPNKNVCLHLTEDAQWLGDGCAMYPIYGMPLLTEENILTMWDVPEDKREKWNFRSIAAVSPALFDDVFKGEQLLQRGISICAKHGLAEPLQTEQGALFINPRYLKPFDDLENGYELYARYDPLTRQPVIAAKEGYSLVGLISPIAVVNDKFITELEELLEMCKLARENSYGTASNE